MPTISDLGIFARVARTGNMSAAGREMGLSPAVVSKRISQLEEKLGTRLFERTTRSITLTETGAGYFKRVVDILNLYQEAEDFVCRRNATLRGLLKVSAPATFGRLHIAPHVGVFLTRYPEIEVDIQLTDAEVDVVRDGFDVAIRIGEITQARSAARKIAADERVICAAPSYLATHGAPAAIADLEYHNCLSVAGDDVWRLEGPEGAVEVRTSSKVHSGSGEFINEALCAGVGIGLRSTWEVGSKLRSGDLKIVLPAYRGPSTMAIYAEYPRREFVPAKVQGLIDFLTEIYGPEPSWDRFPRLDSDAAISLKPAVSRGAKGLRASAGAR